MTDASASPRERGLSNLAQRTLFAIVAIPVVLGAVWLGDWALASILAIASALAAWEFYRIAEKLGTRPMARAGIAIAAAVPLAIHARYLGLPVDTVVSTSVGTLLVIALFSGSIFVRGVSGRPLESVSLTVFGILYTGVLLSFAYVLRYHPYAIGRAAGTAVLMLPLLLVWISDTGAYVVGRTMGKRKLIPSVSPGKTVAGALGALVVSAVASWALVRFVLVPQAQLGLRPVHAILFGIAISTAVQLGDLAESLIKREAGVKDSSHIIPGHGGVLDRIDGMLFALPVAYWLLNVWLIPAPQ
ncbi:MAG TPA: phosphatidate cytidylyltransferase [Gemmatimonadaceae bacterium]|nr:phosphatidate cytidylyltransferase [Gemmatimonadaceae bacterium]